MKYHFYTEFTEQENLNVTLNAETIDDAINRLWESYADELRAKTCGLCKCNGEWVCIIR